MHSFNIRSVETNSFSKTPSPKDLSNEALIRNTQALVAEERRLTTEILWHLHEIQVRRLYAEKGYASLFEYAVQALGYSEAAAGRRIAAMRLLVDVPEIEPAIQQGAVTLSTLSTVQSFIQRKNSNRDNKPVSKAEKKELVMSLQGKSKRECEKVLIELDPLAAVPKERERVVSSTQTEIRFIADDELMRKLQNIKELDAHVLSNPSYLELFHRMADLVLNELDPLAKEKKLSKKTLRPTQATPPAELIPEAAPSASFKSKVSAQHQKTQSGKACSRYIPAALKRAVWKRDQGRCSFQSSDGKKCTSRYALEIDHIVPMALGGHTELFNLRLLCRVHNQQQALTKLGPQIMRPFMSH